MNIANMLVNSARYFPEHIALIDGEREISYGELDQESNRIASGLVGMGIRPGDRVCLCAPNSARWLVFYFGALKAGAVIVSPNVNFSRQELYPLMEETKPTAIFTVEQKHQELKDIRESDYLKFIVCEGSDITYSDLIQKGSNEFKIIDRDRNDVAGIPYTGGTTGTPKGILLTHQNFENTSFNMSYHERTTERDRVICFLPIDHMFAQQHVVQGAILFASGVIIHPSFDLDMFLEDIETKKVTKLVAVPTIYVRLMEIKGLRERLKNIRHCFSAGASMAAGIVSKWKDMTGLDINEAYGLSEAGMLTYNHFYRHVVGSVGTPVHTMEVQIRDQEGNILKDGEEGEICARGPSVMKGYLNRPELNDISFWDEWLRTGDIGYFAENGYLYISGRIKDMIITGGENVYPAEIENALSTREEVKECAVVGLPDEEYGERITAFIIPEENHRVDPAELKSFLKSRMAGYKVPKAFITVSDLPKSSTNKILKREIVRQYIESQNDKKK